MKLQHSSQSMIATTNIMHLYGYIQFGACYKNTTQADEPINEYQIMMANMEALRELDNVVYANAVKMLGWQK